MSGLIKIFSWSLKRRLIAAFIVPACLVLIAGISGLHFLRSVSKETRSVTDVATPIIQAAQKLNAVLYDMGRAGFAALQSDDAATMEEQSKHLVKLSSEFAAELANVEKLTKENLLVLGGGSPDSSQMTGRGTSPKEELSLAKAGSTEKDFSKAASTAVEGRLSYHKKREEVRQKTDEMLNEVSESEKLLQRIKHGVEADFASSEERAKTQVQSRSASVDELNSIIQNFYDADFPILEATYKLQQQLREFRDTIQLFLLGESAERLAELSKSCDAKIAEMNSRVNRTVRRGVSNEVRDELAQFQQRLLKLKEVVLGDKGLFSVYNASLEARSIAESSEKVMMNSLRECETTINQFTVRVNQINASLNTAAKAKIDNTSSLAQTWAMIIAVVGFGISIVLGLFLAGNLSGPIQRLAKQASLVSDGDLTLEIDSHRRSDEVGVLSQAFANMVKSLRTQTRKIGEGVGILASSAREISATVAQMNESVSRASSAIAETTSTAEELRQGGGLSAEKAKMVAETAQEAVRASKQGTEATKDTIIKMSLIREQMTSVNDTVVKLNENTLVIGTIVRTVQDLADQSNLLAVNASIEAARAGESGKGFSVVAQEIKSLADQSKGATKHISGILEEINKSVNRVVMATEQGSKAVLDGVEQSKQSADCIRELEALVVKSSEAASIIDATTAQQFTGIDQVVAAMSNIEVVMNQLVAVSSQLKSGASGLSDLGDDLNGLVEKYKS
jgi:methyl-accepting chemotaxis protein